MDKLTSKIFVKYRSSLVTGYWSATVAYFYYKRMLQRKQIKHEKINLQQNSFDLFLSVLFNSIYLLQCMSVLVSFQEMLGIKE